MARLSLLKPRIAVEPTRVQVAPTMAQERRITGRRLQRIRILHLARFPLCANCLKTGRVSPAEEIDHIVPLHKGGQETPENRQSLCIPCHRAKTIEDCKP